MSRMPLVRVKDRAQPKVDSATKPSKVKKFAHYDHPIRFREG